MNQQGNILLSIVPDVRDDEAAKLFNGTFIADEIKQFNSSILIDIISHSHRTQKYKFMILTSIPGYEEFLAPHLLTNIELHTDDNPPNNYSYSFILDKMKNKMGWKSVVMLAGFHPLITPGHIQSAFSMLEHEKDTIVYGATEEGLLYLCGMNSEHQLLRRIDENIFHARSMYLDQFCSTESMIFPLETLPACSTLEDLHYIRETIEKMVEHHQCYPKKTLEFLRHHERCFNHLKVSE